MVILGKLRNLRNAIQSSDVSKWELVMQEDYESFIANDMWEFTALPKGCKAVNCKWVPCTKNDANGMVFYYKARLVTKKCSQVESVDFGKTFAPITKINTIKDILT